MWTGVMYLFFCLIPFSGFHVTTVRSITGISNVFNKDGTIKYRSDGSQVLRNEYGYSNVRTSGPSGGMIILLILTGGAGRLFLKVSMDELKKFELLQKNKDTV